MSTRTEWTYDEKHFCETHTARGGRRYFIDGKPTPKAQFLAALAAAKAAELDRLYPTPRRSHSDGK